MSMVGLEVVSSKPHGHFFYEKHHTGMMQGQYVSQCM